MLWEGFMMCIMLQFHDGWHIRNKICFVGSLERSVTLFLLTWFGPFKIHSSKVIYNRGVQWRGWAKLDKDRESETNCSIQFLCYMLYQKTIRLSPVTITNQSLTKIHGTLDSQTHPAHNVKQAKTPVEDSIPECLQDDRSTEWRTLRVQREKVVMCDNGLIIQVSMSGCIFYD